MQLASWSYILVVLVSAYFSAYTQNMQKTTLFLGKQLAADNPLLPRGLQDALTPSWQTRNNFVMFGLWIGVIVFGLVAFRWYWAVVGFVMFLLATVLFSLWLLPRAGSPHYLKAIRRSLEQRVANYGAAGDEARAMAAREIIRRLDSFLKRADSVGTNR